MPLHGQPERDVGEFHGLHDPVVSACGHGEAGADPVDGLVVVDGNGKRHVQGVEQPVQPRLGFHVHVHDVEDATAGLVAAVAHDVGQVLVQGAALCDVEHLGAAADAEQRQLPVDGPVDQLMLPGVTVPPRLVGFRVGGLTVTRRIDVLAAGDDQAVEAVEHPVGNGRVHGLRRQQHGDAARADDRVEIGLGQEGGRHVPDTGLGLLEIGGQADHGARVGSGARRGAGVRGAQSRAPAPSRSPPRHRLPARSARC